MDYNFREIEKKWQKQWVDDKTYKVTEDVIELSVHGGTAMADGLLEALLLAGAEPAAPELIDVTDRALALKGLKYIYDRNKKKK